MAKSNRIDSILETVADRVPDVETYGYALPDAKHPRTTFTSDSGQQFELIHMDKGLPLIQQAGTKRPRSLATEAIAATEYHNDPRLVATVVDAMRTARAATPQAAKGKAAQQTGDWRVQINGKLTSDTFTPTELADRLATGSLAGRVLCWRPGMAAWAEPAQCPDLARQIMPPIT